MSTQKQAVETEAKKAMSAEEAFHTNQHDHTRAEFRNLKATVEESLRSRGKSPVDAVYAAAKLAGNTPVEGGESKVDAKKAIDEVRRIGREAEERLRKESGTKAPREVVLSPAQIGGAVIGLTLLGGLGGAGIHTVISRRAANKAAAAAAAAASSSGNLPLG